MEDSIVAGDAVLEASIKIDIPEKQAGSRNLDGTFPKGVSGNPAGRPKGRTMKEFAREFLMSMTPEQKYEFLRTVDPDVVWRMAEGNPHQTQDVEVGMKPVPILDDVSKNDRDKQDTPAD